MLLNIGFLLKRWMQVLLYIYMYKINFCLCFYLKIVRVQTSDCLQNKRLVQPLLSLDTDCLFNVEMYSDTML